jgi:hypothetical protein
MSDLSESESDNEDDQDRMRDMLASYYGMAKPEEGAGGAGGGGGSGEGQGRMSQSSSSSQAHQQQRRGGGGGGGGPGSGGGGGGRGSASGFGEQQWQMINSPSFQPQRYVKHLLQTGSMDTLLRKDDELVFEVKSLDSDMQMLVYENYNKFIAATDTIRKMKVCVSFFSVLRVGICF